jgi:polyisoprenyl-teichoic acid--peptidoglycan teichoic acid transferase
VLEGPGGPGGDRPSIRAPRAAGDDRDPDQDDAWIEGSEDEDDVDWAEVEGVDIGDTDTDDAGDIGFGVGVDWDDEDTTQAYDAEDDRAEDDQAEDDRAEDGYADDGRADGDYTGGDYADDGRADDGTGGDPYRRPPVGSGGGGGSRSPAPPRRPGSAPRAVLVKQRRRRRRFIVGLTFFLSATVSMVGTTYVYLQYRIGQIPRVGVPSLVEDQRGGVMNVLLVGSDSRDRLEGKDALQAGKGSVSGQRSDTIMVLHIDPGQEQAAILSIPRDLYLPIAGTDYSDRVNAAFSLGGAQGLIETIQGSLGITINHYVEVDFVGFKDIVDAVGGVQLYLPAWARDFTSGLDLPKIGCVNVDGTQGLAWVRSRNFEYLLEDGLTWVPDPRADLGRIERQQDFIRRMLKKALSSGLTNPIQLNRLLGIGVRDVTLDETLSTKDITTLARRFNNLDADSVALFTLPTTPDEVDGASVLRLREDEAQPYLDRINGLTGAGIPTPGAPEAATTTLPPEALLYPEDVDIRVLNGEGTPGAAGRAAADLQDAGFVVDGTGDTAETRRTTIRYAVDALPQAQLLDSALMGGADLVLDSVLSTTDLVLVIGADYQGLNEGSVKPIPRPSTTVTEETGSTTTSEPTTSTVPPTTLGPTTLPPGEEC